MDLGLGDRVRALRKQMGITQERLAEQMGVCFQTVSKWETEAAYPDITILPRLANFFGVTTDALLGVDEQMNEQRIQDYLKQYDRCNNVGDMKAKEALMRAAIAEFPGDFRLMVKRAWTLIDALDGPYTGPDESLDFSVNSDAIEGLCQRVVDDCADDRLRFEAMYLMSKSYVTKGETERAAAMAKRFPLEMEHQLLEGVYPSYGDEAVTHRQHNVQDLTDQLRLRMYRAAQNPGLSRDDKATLYQKGIALLELIYEDGDFHFYHCQLADQHLGLVGCCIRDGDAARALHHLARAAEHLVSFDELPDEIAHTSVLVDRLIQRRENTGKCYVGTKSGSELERLRDPFYDPIRDTDGFRAAEEELRRCDDGVMATRAQLRS